MSLNTFSSGVNTSFSSELNENFSGSAIQQIYTSTGFNASETSASSSTSNNVEMDAVVAASIGSADYVIIEVNANHITDSDNAVSANTALKFEIKEVSGSYGTIMDRTILWHKGEEVRSFLTTRYVHTLTAGEKSNGFQIKITGTATLGAGASSDDASITNVQTIIKLGV